jgi:dTDP-D-glucose 4,6-dehydratase
VANYEKLTKTVGWKPKIGIEEGLKKTLEYYEKNKNEFESIIKLLQGLINEQN